MDMVWFIKYPDFFKIQIKNQLFIGLLTCYFHPFGNKLHFQESSNHKPTIWKQMNVWIVIIENDNWRSWNLLTGFVLFLYGNGTD